MKLSQITTVKVIFALILLIALGVRMINLGTTPLSDAEAGWALQSLGIARGESVAIGEQSGYIVLTSILFFVLGNNNFLARFWPALIGSLAVFCPYLFRKQIGHWAAIILACGLAIDPGMVELSRQAGGTMLAFGFGFLALGLILIKKPCLAGILAGLFLLSGPAIFHGIFGLSLAWFALRRLQKSLSVSLQQTQGGTKATKYIQIDLLKQIGISAGATVLIAGTLFFLLPQGLGAWTSTLLEYIKGWLTSSDVPATRLLVSLVVYQPLALIYALVTIVKTWLRKVRMGQVDDPAMLCFLWLVLSLVLTCLYPARQMADLVWAVPLLWALAAMGLAEEINIEPKIKWISVGQAAVIFLLLSLLWLQLASLSQALVGTRFDILRLGMIIGICILGISTTVLTGLGWSEPAARQGLALGFILSLGLYTISSTWGISQAFTTKGQVFRQDLWNPNYSAIDADILTSTMMDLSGWHTGRKEALDIHTSVDVPSMRWVLRDFPNARFVDNNFLLSYIDKYYANDLPSLILTYQYQETSSLAVSYRGQDFIWGLHPGWKGILPPDILKWLIFRQAPWEQDQVVLWARGDLFPGGALVPYEQTPTLDGEKIPENIEPAE